MMKKSKNRDYKNMRICEYAFFGILDFIKRGKYSKTRPIKIIPWGSFFFAQGIKTKFTKIAYSHISVKRFKI